MTTSRKLEPKDLVGKTVKHVECTSVNYVVLHFTDGTKLELESENVGHGIYGIIVQVPDEVKSC